MAKKSSPRHGSMQFWPRKRAKRHFARVRSFVKNDEVKPAGFAGYKIGMTHITVIDNRKNSLTKGEELTFPVTLVEVPNLFVYGVRLYKENDDGLRIVSEKTVKAPKNLLRRGPYAKKENNDELNKDADIVRLLVSTQPEKTNSGKKTAEVFEIEMSGSFEYALNYALEKLGKEISVDEVFKELDLIDVHAVTKGKGYQGPVKRFGVTLRSHKSEKVRRGPGSLGAWLASVRQFRVAHAGQMGYHQRVDYNKQIITFLQPEDLQVKGGILHYGFPKSKVMLLKGSVPGTKKRLLRFTLQSRPAKKTFTQPVEIVNVSLKSQQ